MEEINCTTGYSCCGRSSKKEEVICTQSVQFVVTKHCRQHEDEHDNLDRVFKVFINFLFITFMQYIYFSTKLLFLLDFIQFK